MERNNEVYSSMAPCFSAAKFLGHLLDQKQQLNSEFSLRSFATLLKISPSTLSDFLNGKRKISIQNASRIALSLGFDREEMAHFLILVAIDSADEVATQKSLKDKILGHEMNHFLMRNKKREIEGIFSQLKVHREIRYAQGKEMTFRVLTQYKNRSDQGFDCYFTDSFLSHEVGVQSWAYFLRNSDGSFSSYLSRNVPRPGDLELAAKSNLRLKVDFCSMGFPHIHNMVLAFTTTEFRIKGSLFFDHEKVVIDGKKYHSTNSHLHKEPFFRSYKRLY